MDSDYFPSYVLLADMDDTPDDTRLLLYARLLVLHTKRDNPLLHYTSPFRNAAHCRFLG